MAVEVGEQRLAIGTLGCGGEPHELIGPEAGHQRLVRVGRQVVAFVDDDVTKVRHTEAVDEGAGTGEAKLLSDRTGPEEGDDRQR